MIDNKSFDKEYNDIMQVKDDGTSLFSNISTIKNSRVFFHNNIRSLTVSIVISLILMLITVNIIDNQMVTRELTFVVEGALALLIAPGITRKFILLLESYKALRAMNEFDKHKNEFDNAFNSFNSVDM